MAEGDRAGGRAKRRRFLVTTCLAGALLGLPAAARAQSAAPAETAAFAIPAQPLARALDAFSRASGWEVGYPSPIVRGRTSQAVSGTMQPAEALQALLAGTGIGLRMTGPSTAALVAPSVETVGAIEEASVVLDTLSVEGRSDGVQGLVARSSSFGTKTSTPLIETPQTINVVTRSQIDIQQPQNVMQALRYTAGVSADWLGPTNMGENYYINARGFVLSQYLDGLRTGAVSGPTLAIDPFLIERIEVLKGPASTLYGTSPPGGLLNITSKRPTDTPLRAVEFQTGSYGRAQTGFDLGGPIDDESRFLYRLTGVGHTADTQFGHGTKDQVAAIAPALTWRPDADTSLTLFGKYQYVPNTIGYQFLPALGTVLPSPNGKIPYRLFTGDRSLDNSWIRQASIGYELKHRFESDWELRQNARAEHFKFQHLFVYAMDQDLSDPTGRTENRFALFYPAISDRFDVDTQLEGRFATGALRHDLLVGFDFQRTALGQRTGLATAKPLNLYVPVYRGSEYPFIVNSNVQEIWQAGLYVQDQVKLGAFMLSLGGRYDWTGSETTIRSVSPRTTTRQDDSAFSGRVGLSYLLDLGLVPYVSYATSFEPVPGIDYVSKPFQPSTGEQYEAGIKYQPPGYNTFLQASVFDITQQNVLTADPVHIDFQTQTGEVRSRGVELEARASLSEGLDLILAYAHLETKVTKSNGDDLGKQLTNAPDDLVSAFLTYRFQGGPFTGLTLGGGLRYTGLRYATPNNTWDSSAGPYAGTRSRLPDYTLVDAVLSYDFGVRYPDLAGLQLQVNASNLLGTEYVASCTGAVASCYYGWTRTVYATLRYRF